MPKSSLHNVVSTILFFVSIMLMGCITDDHDENKGLAIGDKIPAFIVDAIIEDTADWRYNNGEGIRLSSQMFTGRVGIIIFFNTDCEDCQKELPEIQKLYDEIKKDNNYQLICIAREENADEIKNYWIEHGLTLPFSAQTDRSVYNLFANTIIPRIYITDLQSTVTYVHADSPIATSEQIKLEITTLTK